MSRGPPQYKEAFVKKYENILGSETKEFLETSLKRLPSVIRVNTLKTSVDEIKDRMESRGWKVSKLKFYEPALKIENRDMALGNTIEHFLGYFYVQETASMLPPIVLEPQEDDYVLDTSAAPGSKTTQISQMMENKGIIFANEPNLARLSALRANCQRMGSKNVVTTKMDATRMKKTEFFDKVLVDAPCSAIGAIRKKWDIILQWNPSVAQRLSNLQRRILESGINACKEGGVVVYSTCTLEPEENEGVVDYALKNLSVELEEVKIKSFKTRQGLTKWNSKDFDSSLKKTARVYPQDNDTEGFYIARLRKI